MLQMGCVRFSLILALTLAQSALAQVNVPAGATINVPAGGSMNLGCVPLNVQGAFNIGSGQVSNTGNVSIGAGGNLNGGQGTLSVSGNWSNGGTFVAGTGTVVFTDGCASGPIQFTGTTQFNNLTLSSNTGRNFIFPPGSVVTITGTLTLQGTPGQPINLLTAGGQTTFVMAPGAQLVSNNASGFYVDQNGNVIIGPPSIPTLSEYGLMLLSLLMAGTALWRGRSRTFGAQRKNQHL
ncbi:MAG: IPTL-CTERM sorting domain-containing protein [Rhodoferax sp.]